MGAETAGGVASRSVVDTGSTGTRASWTSFAGLSCVSDAAGAGNDVDAVLGALRWVCLACENFVFVDGHFFFFFGKCFIFLVTNVD